VLNIQSSEDDQNTVKFIAQLAESFGAELCVEGVETQEMRDMLRRFNVTTFQGFFYSRPIPLEEFCEKYNC
jgi:EAL domain-containing protein (putative c-di-GMP-specific phosphodiesterase class I)